MSFSRWCSSHAYEASTCPSCNAGLRPRRAGRCRVLLPQCGRRLLPVDGYLARHVAAESVDAAVEPKAWRPPFAARMSRCRSRRRCPSVILHDGVAQQVTYIPVGRALLDPAGIGQVWLATQSRITRSPSLWASAGVSKILQRAEFGVDGFVVREWRSTSRGFPALADADGVGGHQPDDVHAQFSEPGQVACGRRQRPFGGVLARSFRDDRL